MKEEKESLVVVGGRPTLPNQKVDMVEDYDQNLRCRGSSGLSSPPETGIIIDQGLAASTPAQAIVGMGMDESRRVYPCFGTPGSIADMCPDQGYLMLPPLDVKDSILETPSPDFKLKFDQTYQLDSGYGNGGSEHHSGMSKRSSLFDNPEGSYVLNSSIWELFSPVRDLKRKWKGRPSYLDDYKGVDKFSFDPQQLLGCLMLMVISASVGFTVLISVRHIDETNMYEINSKYKSIEFGSQKLIDKLRKEGRLLEGVKDENGNKLGGKKAAIQFSYDQGAKSLGDEILGKRDDPVVKNIEVDLKKLEADDATDPSGVMVDNDLTEINEESLNTSADDLMSDDLKTLEAEIGELENKKRRKLELIKKVKSFNKQMVTDGPKPRKFRVADELPIEVKGEAAEVSLEKKEMRKRKAKSPANPISKSLPKKLKMSKAKRVAKTDTVEESDTGVAT